VRPGLGRAVPVTLAALALPWSGRSAAQQARPAPYEFGWSDAASVVTAGGLGLLPALLKLPHGTPECAPCDPRTLPAVDRWALRPSSTPASTASTVLVGGVTGLAGGFALGDPPADDVRGNLGVLASALAWTAAATEWLKVSLHRKRPVLYTRDATAVARDRDSRESFPSGHTSLAFAGATAYLVMARRERLPHTARNAVLLYTGAAGVGGLRIVAGRHFLSDVLGGAVLGSAIGWLVPAIHPRRL
jgi:membrane-associated phospholipid phosphatase